MKVVFDTNIYVSALMFPGGEASKALRKIIISNESLVISKNILEELLRVLAEKFERDAEALSRIALFISSISETVKPRRKLSVLDDEPDNRILECAVGGNADTIVTGDKAMLGLGEYKGVRIITLKEYLKSL